VVGVDAGTVALAGSGWAGEAYFELDGPGVIFDAAVSPSGFGDGCYDVVEIERHGTVVGVEVVFIDAAADAEVARLVTRLALQGRVVEPAEEDWKEYFLRRFEDPASERFTRAAATISAWEKVRHMAWEEWLGTEPVPGPPTDLDATVLGMIDVDGRVMVGDPCSGVQVDTPVPAGPYQAVAWDGVVDGWGTRVARLGIYRLG
jgi:hypothetical protein